MIDVSVEHHPECRGITLRDFAAEQDRRLPTWVKPEAAVRRCHEDCPHHERTAGYLREFARRFNW
jgi:hypothetical protein